jgi:hypothetical protein
MQTESPSLKSGQTLTVEQATRLLPDGDWVHVFIEKCEPEMWSRKKVIESFENFGVRMGDWPSILHQHGLFIPSEPVIYVQMRKEPPSEPTVRSDAMP